MESRRHMALEDALKLREEAVKEMDKAKLLGLVRWESSYSKRIGDLDKIIAKARKKESQKPN